MSNPYKHNPYIQKRWKPNYHNNYSKSNEYYQNYQNYPSYSNYQDIFEKVKSEVVSSVLDWLTIYLANKDNIKDNDELFCECGNRKTRSKMENKDFLKLMKNNDSLLSDFSDKMSTVDDHNYDICEMDKEFKGTNKNMMPTGLTAGQVWPDWCKFIAAKKTRNDKHTLTHQTDIYNSPVYFDNINNRLCLSRHGLVEYPKMINSQLSKSKFGGPNDNNFSLLQEIKDFANSKSPKFTQNCMDDDSTEFELDQNAILNQTNRNMSLLQELKEMNMGNNRDDNNDDIDNSNLNKSE